MKVSDIRPNSLKWKHNPEAMKNDVYLAMNITKNTFDELVKGSGNSTRTFKNTFAIIAEA